MELTIFILILLGFIFVGLRESKKFLTILPIYLRIGRPGYLH